MDALTVSGTLSANFPSKDILDHFVIEIHIELVL